MDTSEQPAIESAKQEKRRRRSVEEKRRIVEETLEAGASVARVARRHAVNANQVFYWRKKYREGRLGKNQSSKLLPVTLSDIHGVFRHKFVGLSVFSTRGDPRVCTFLDNTGRQASRLHANDPSRLVRSRHAVPEDLHEPRICTGENQGRSRARSDG